MEYNEDEYLLLSGIQHFRFCRRQWALIHIEKQWKENFRTVEGEAMHARAHDSGLREKRGDLVITRGLAIASVRLGVSGACDVVEYRRSEDGISLPGVSGLFQPYPVEYKHGLPREDNANELQLCGQAMCLEEMLCCDIPKGALYFGEVHRRMEVRFTEELRQEVLETLTEMHQMYRRGYTPKVKPFKSCNACSLKEICIPKPSRCGSVSGWIEIGICVRLSLCFPSSEKTAISGRKNQISPFFVSHACTAAALCQRLSFCLIQQCFRLRFPALHPEYAATAGETRAAKGRFAAEIHG